MLYLQAAQTGQCDPSCEEFSSICPPCTRRCPARCQDAARTGQCDPSCVEYRDLCPCDPLPSYTPAPPPTTPAPVCPARCLEAANTGYCDASCDALGSLCPPCNPRTCPASCLEAASTGQCLPSCQQYSGNMHQHRAGANLAAYVILTTRVILH